MVSGTHRLAPLASGYAIPVRHNNNTCLFTLHTHQLNGMVGLQGFDCVDLLHKTLCLQLEALETTLSHFTFSNVSRVTSS